jgi:hypothetical protein
MALSPDVLSQVRDDEAYAAKSRMTVKPGDLAIARRVVAPRMLAVGAPT